MLSRASVDDLKKGKVKKGREYIVVTMIFYPRFVSKELIDEYDRRLAPPEALFREFKTLDRKLKNHNAAFTQVNYESRFELTDEGMESLRHLSERARAEDVVLICQCRDYDRCHCDLLLLMAQKHYNAPVKGLLFDYPDFKKRLSSLS